MKCKETGVYMISFYIKKYLNEDMKKKLSKVNHSGIQRIVKKGYLLHDYKVLFLCSKHYQEFKEKEVE